MKVWAVTEENGYRCIVVGIYKDKEKAMDKMKECLAHRSINECEVE